MFRNLLLLSSVSLLLSGCFWQKAEEKWTSFIYPDKENTKRNIKSPMTFKSLEECQKESVIQLQKLNLTSIGTFKCGLNCEFHDGMKTEICSKVLAASEK